MTKKDYVAIGRALRQTREEGGIGSIALRNVSANIADAFAVDNPDRFDRQRFLRFVETGRDTCHAG